MIEEKRKAPPKHETRISATYTAYCVSCPWSSSLLSSPTIAAHVAAKHREEHA